MSHRLDPVMTDLSLDLSASLWSDVQPEASRRLLLAALESFSARGFHATTTRDIARGAGMSPAAVYVHYTSKADLLYEISRAGHADMLAAVEAGLAAGTDPIDRLRRFVAAFASWSAHHHTLARVVQYEFEALPPDRHDELREMRRLVRHLVERELQAGIDAGDIDVPDLTGTAVAALSLCADVARWYGSSHPQGPDEIGALYADLVERMIRAPR